MIPQEEGRFTVVVQGTTIPELRAVILQAPRHWSSGLGRHLDSRLYEIQMAGALLESAYGQTQKSFVSMSAGEIDAFVRTPAFRKASRILARDVLTFRVGVDPSTGSIDWQMDASRSQ